MSGKIFINYRRDDASYPAGRLYDRLSASFPQNQIFIDVDNLDPGVDFVEAIEQSVGSCDVLIAVIGKGWLTSHDQEGQRRLHNPDDFVRIEIATALKRNIRVIPVLVDDASMPRPSDLPDDLKSLLRRNAVEVSHTRFSADSERLIAALERVFEKTAAEQREREEKERLAAEHAETEKERLEAERKQKEERDRLETEQREREEKGRLEWLEAGRPAREQRELEHEPPSFSPGETGGDRKRLSKQVIPFLAIAVVGVAVVSLLFVRIHSTQESRPSANAAKQKVSQPQQSPSLIVPAMTPLPSPVSSAKSTRASVVNRDAKVSVLCYHRFEDNPSDALAIAPAEFRTQMKQLKDSGIEVISMKDFLAWRRGEKSIPPRSAIITIDDGYVSAYNVAWPILKEFGYPFTMFIYTNYVGVGGKSMTWPMLEEMRDAGVDIESKTVSHHDLRHAPNGQDYTTWLHNEIYGSKDILEQKLGINIVAFAFPYGTHNDVVRKMALDAGYQALFTVHGEHMGIDAPADQLGRYAVESMHPDVFESALDFGPESHSSSSRP
jgi:peptidoglycan/xylan/chitin deacetylase (PgdA/CDA1 family)